VSENESNNPRNSGPLYATLLTVATLALIAIGTIWPNASAVALAGGEKLLRPSTTPEAAVTNLAQQIGQHSYDKAYATLGNKAEFSEQQFLRDLTGDYPSLRTYATLDSFDLRPLHASDTAADIELRMRWSTVVGTFLDTRDIHVTRSGDRWAPAWPLVNEPRVPPQVIPVNYLRWDVIYRGAGDDWGAQDVEGPHVRIVDMHPVDRADGTVIMGELLNEDVVPAFVTVKATLLAKNGSTISSEGGFDKISHLLLPKQVTPFLITFPGVSLAQVASVRMDPLAELVSASADPIIEVQDQKFNPGSAPALGGQLVNESGQLVDVAHVLGTFYDKSGNLVWVADQYIDRALLPQQPVPFHIAVPPDLAKYVSTQRTVVATYSSGRFE
jgi:hypothetical protein